MNLNSGKTSLIRLIAVRETGVSRHQGGPIEGPPGTPRTSQHYHIGGIIYIHESQSTRSHYWYSFIGELLV